MTRWIALAVLAAVGATILLTWPDVKEESGREKARSLYGFTCPPRCDLGPSYVTFRVSKLFERRFDGGPDWGAAARKAGLKLEPTPAIGAVAWFGGDRVAFVERVLGPDAVEISELSAETLTRRTVTRASGWPQAFILVGPRASDAPVPPTGDSTLI